MPGSSMAPSGFQDTALVRAVTDLFGDLSDFIQKELRLLQAELTDKVTQRLKAGIWIAGAGFLAVVAFLLVVEGIVFAIASAGLGLYWSCFVVAAAIAVIAAVMFYYGRASMGSDNLVPTRSARQLSQAMSTAKEQLR
jgi:hypothetical protein